MPGKEAVEEALRWLQEHSTEQDRANLDRFGITAKKALGVSMANIRMLAKRLGRNHKLAADLWKTGWYEARMLASLVDEPAKVTGAQMDRWCRDFDNWGICDTVCFCLFDRVPLAWEKADEWRKEEPEFVKRAAFALVASIAGHDKEAGDDVFLQSLPWIEEAAGDGRNFVKKGVSWALRRIGTRNARLRREALAVAVRLSDSGQPSARWIGRGAVRDLSRSATKKSRRSESGSIEE